MSALHELYFELNRHLLQDEEPSQYLNSICDKPVFQQYPFDMLLKLMYLSIRSCDSFLIVFDTSAYVSIVKALE